MPITPTKLLLRPTFNIPESETRNETQPFNTASFKNAQYNFPLRPRSKDHLLLLQDDQVLSDDYELFLKILQVATTPSKTEKDGHIEKITEELANRQDISQGATPLHYACMNGNLHMVAYLLENGAQVDMWDVKERVTPLMAAAFHNRVEVTKLLLEHGCDVDAGLNCTTDGVQSALSWAIRKNHGTIVSILLEHCACQTSTVAFSETPMHAAVARGSPEILKLLISAQGDELNSEFQMGSERNTALHLAATGKHKNSLELCKILVEEGNAFVDPPNDLGRTPLHTAVLSQKIKIVNYLLSRSAKVNAIDIDGRTPLFHAIRDEPEALECIDALIKTNKCNISHQDEWGNTPLHLAAVNGSEDICEIFLMNGADFSAKANSGSSALSILRKKIPKTDELLSKSFDQAVKLVNFEGTSPTEKKGQNCKMIVDFKYILPSATSTSGRRPSGRLSVANIPKFSRLSRLSTRLFRDTEEDKEKASSTRKETSKLKCLLEEEYSNLLLHPVIHSFLDLKWHKARFVLLPTLVLKLFFVTLFSIYVKLHYHFLDEAKKDNPNWNATTAQANSTNTNSTISNGGAEMKIEEEPHPVLTTMYIIVLIMALFKGVLGLIQILRAPKQQLKTVHPWISWAVLLITFFLLEPIHWKTLSSFEPIRKSMEALGILLAWIDIWIDMGRLPKGGLSIRVFLQVLTNFWRFILPHCCLLIGFILAFTSLFPDNGEFQSFSLALSKIIRVMAGDVTLVDEGSKINLIESPYKEIIAHNILVYIFTAYIVVVAIVLGNLLIGLAVNDIQGIYKDAAADKLVKQTILLNTLETSIHGRWTRFCIPKEVLAKYINLFRSQDSDDKTITFNPYDPLDRQLGSDLKKELLDIGSVNQVAESQKEQNTLSTTTSALSLKGKRLSNIASKIMKMRKTSVVDADEEKRLLLETISKLTAYLENKS